MDYLCDKEDMTKVLSLHGIVAFSDHDETGEANDDVIDDCRGQATDEITGWLVPLYEANGLSESRLVKRWTAIHACVLLCKTQGNPVPDSLYDEFDRIFKSPEGLVHKAKTGKFVITDARRTSTNVPSFSNLTVDRRYRYEQVRVTPQNSSPVPSQIEQDITHRHISRE